MKKIIFLAYFLCFFGEIALACDVCGCGVGSYYLGIMPQFHKNFVGIRYRYKTYDSHLGAMPSYLDTKETYQNAELWARFYLNPKIQLIGFLPYNFNQQQSASETKTLSGLGDAVLMLNYNLFNNSNDLLQASKDSTKTFFKHNLWLGGGIKLPTGKSSFKDDGSQVANPNFQLGTGSVDFMLNFIYTLRYQKIGLNTDFTYKINLKNSENYLFGNRLNGNISAFFMQNIKNVMFMPNLGIAYEAAEKNLQNGLEIDATGGTATFSSLGLETYYRNLTVGFNYQNPMQQFLSGGQIKANDRFMVHFTVLF